MDVLIVAREDDGVALRLGQALVKKGRRVSHHDGPSAARLFTIRVSSAATSVLPSVPVFFRASAWWHKSSSESADERFLRAEAYATFWSAAALSTMPIINRPGPNGVVSRITAGGLVAIPDAPRTAQPGETWVSCPELIGAGAEQMWGEDQDCRVAPVAQFRRGTPLRARAVNPAALYEVVTVVGKRGFCATSDPRSVELRLSAKSVAIVERVGIHFATVTWVVEDGDAMPVRLNATPEEFELRYHWSDVADALCEDLTQ